MSDIVKAEVVRIGTVEKHPNADSLSITTVLGGFPVIFTTGSYVEGQLAVYVPVDSLVPATKEWDFLWKGGPNPRPKDRRIKAKKLRGIFSMGILTDAPAGFVEGDNAADALSITKYEDPAESEGVHPRQPNNQRPLSWFVKTWRKALRWLGFKVGNTSSQALYGMPAPELEHLPGHYDIEHFRRYGKSWFNEGEDVVVTEKIHGQNVRYVVDAKGKFHLKSRTVWRENDPTRADNAWAKAAAKYDIEAKLASVPGLILYGEVYGNFADLPYGASNEDPGFVAFDVFDSHTGEWLSHNAMESLCKALDLPTAPVLFRGPIEAVNDNVEKLAEGKTRLLGPPQALDVRFGCGHVREGFVIKPSSGRCLPGGQRIILKQHGEGFLTRKDADKPFDAKPALAQAA